MPYGLPASRSSNGPSRVTGWRWRPGGIVLASGIFIDREAEVADAFGAAGLDIFERTADGDWVALAARRPA